MNRLFDLLPNKEEDKKYNKKMLVPQYLPSKKKPKLPELYDTKHYTDLVRNINLSDLDEDIKEFLKLAASRHIVFNYSKIADYYAHADAKTQRLMEESALVIIDINDAIANGYVKLSKNVQKIMNESGVNTKE